MTLSDIKILQIESTSHCNAACPHCSRFDDRGLLHPNLSLAHLNADLLIKNLQISQLTNLKQVLLEGDRGDPLMHPDIEKLIAAFSNAPTTPKITLVTNGAIRSKIWWAKLGKKAYPGLEVHFSIDGLEDTNHLYRVNLHFDKILENAQAFIAAGGKAVWKFIRFKHNQHQIQQALELSQQLGFAEFHSVPCRIGSFQGLKQFPVWVQGKVTHSIQPGDDIHSIQITEHTPTPKIKLGPLNYSKLCPNLVRGQINITYQGHVIPCCMMHFDTELPYAGTTYLKELTQGLENQDINCLLLSTILSNPLFDQTLTQSLLNGKWHSTCTKSCKTQIIQLINKNHDNSTL